MTTVQPDPAHPARRRRDIGSETKASYKTSELIVYIVMVIALLIAAAVADEASDFGTQEVFKFLTWLTIGYMLARGLAKSGSRASNDDDQERVLRR